VGLHLHHHASRVAPGRLQKVVAASKVPVLVEFAERDAPACRMEEPVLAAILRRYPDGLSVVQADIETSPSDAQTYGITAVPTFVLFVGGAERLRLTGYKSVDELAAALDAELGERT